MTMEQKILYCQFCQRRIGIIRRFRDMDYCSDEHRLKMCTRSARVLRDVGCDIYTVEDNWNEHQVSETPIRQVRQEKPKEGSLPGLALILSFAAGIAFFAFLGRDASSTIDPAPPSLSRNDGIFSQLVNKLPTGTPTISIRETFSSGQSHWQGKGVSTWNFDSGIIRPAELKIWKESTKLSDYRFQFEGKIERRGMSWVFRAPNLQNYYATKLNLGGKGKPAGSAEIVRYLVMNGKAGEKERLPIPIFLRTSEFFRVDVKVKGDRFTTFLNGQVIDVWQDSQLRTGGVGFFNDEGALSALKWVVVSEADTFAEKIKNFLYLSYIILPPLV